MAEGTGQDENENVVSVSLELEDYRDKEWFGYYDDGER